MKKCGFVIRVSTDRQAMNKEGSLTNQLQRLEAHVNYKNIAGGNEQWCEGARYVLKAVSGKDSFKSPEFARLFEDIKAGRVNTILCTSLDRISRSVKDFLNFFEILTQYDVEFVCLKQNYDTTSPQGKLFITIMMALAEFEREQTSERNKDATMARSERGLWNGSRVFGYDLDPNRKGYLIPNENEKIVVNFAYDTYLECGSIYKTVNTLNNHGFRTKEYQSRRDKFHQAREFVHSTVQTLLTNFTYIGKKEINKSKKGRVVDKLPESARYRIVDAVWEAIVDERKFYSVQELIAQNTNSNHNAVKPINHNYLLNSGLLWCGCGSEMEGTCGTGRANKKYYYYKCKNKECNVKVTADDMERIILDRIKQISTNDALISGIINSTNNRLQNELPDIKNRKELLQKELAEVKSAADSIMNQWATMATNDNNGFLKEKLDELGKRRKDIESGLDSIELMVNGIERDSVTKELVLSALNRFTETFQLIKPYKQKELLRLFLHKAILSEDEMKIALYGNLPDIGLSLTETESNYNNLRYSRSQASDWLPALVNK